ncbi:hypothetical protein UFOVP605_57 [uncultured Caudovirales phage]|uniref:Phage tail assembly chaperone protein, TAC n=1 Tax=uncultured Caudovirales phage TaxID=2100421 RepID=A0A6J5N844_9CAUD|nr:hypothetical protein UFOVP605_57 [uncultured Caudovirales phage]
MPMLTREQILAVVDLPKIEVEVPEWGGTVLVSTMSGTARDRFESSLLDATGNVNAIGLRAKMAAACIVDEHGTPMFSPGDIEALSLKSAAALNRVVNAARSLNGLGDDGVNEAKKD